MTKYLVFFLKYYPNCVSILYKKCCRVLLLTKLREHFYLVFYNCLFLQMCRTLYFALAWPFLPFFNTNVQCHIIKILLTSTIRPIRENIQPRSSCIDQYSKTSVGYFPVLSSLSVSKLLVFVMPIRPINAIMAQ
jgi:hypothetical protein